MSFLAGSRERIFGWCVALAIAMSFGDASAHTLKTLYDFCPRQNCPDGAGPDSPLLMDQSGNLLGTTYWGGTEKGPNGSGGTVFELSHRPTGRWAERVLHSFCHEPNCTDGWYPTGRLIRDAAGNLYGIARGGNDFAGCTQLDLCQGIAYELTPDSRRTRWKFRIIHRFCQRVPNCTDGAQPFSGLTYAGAASGAPYDGVSPLYVVTHTGGAQNLTAI